MKAIKVLGKVDEQHRLAAEVPASIPPGMIEVLLVLPSADQVDEGTVWMDAIAREWAEELADPREDIYSIEDGDAVVLQSA